MHDISFRVKQLLGLSRLCGLKRNQIGDGAVQAEEGEATFRIMR